MPASRALVALHGRLRLKHLRLLDVLARSENLHVAAAEMNLTQPAASKILRDLEDLLGVRLFERLPRGMVPTEIGRFVIDYARRMLTDTERFLEAVTNLKQGGYGALAVGAIMATASGILPRAIAELKRRRPLMTIRLVADTSDQLLTALEQKELDVVIGRFTQPRHQALFDLDPLDNEDLWIFAAAGHPLASHRALTLAEMGGSSWVLQPQTSPMRQLLDRCFARAGLRSLDSLVETTSIWATLRLVQEAGMVSVLPSSIVAEGVARGALARLPVALDNPLERYGLITRRGEPLPANVQAFAAILREQTKADRAL